jgi:fatty acid desaturase
MESETGTTSNMAMDRKREIEWPTVGLIAVTYGVLLAVVWFHASLPWWLILPVGAYAAALHASLQHEVLHGHPTGNRVVNETMVFPTPTFWLPYLRYKQTHLSHHNDANLTDPRLDPESYYLLPDTWAAMPGVRRFLFQVNHTLAGRMLIGPAVSIARFWSAEIGDILNGNRATAKAWAWFVPAVAITVWYVVWVCGMPFWQYYVLVAYPGISLALVRSYCEHQAAEHVDHRTIIVEASPFWSLLFLYNNLHVAHHARPAMAWYRLPAFYRTERDRLIAQNNGYLMAGYGEIFSRHFLKAKEPVPYPNMAWLKKSEAPPFPVARRDEAL